MGERLELDYKNHFDQIKISDTCISYRWNLNDIPNGCDQIILLAQLIQNYKDQGKEIKLRPDQRKRAKGLIVVFINDPSPLQES